MNQNNITRNILRDMRRNITRKITRNIARKITRNIARNKARNKLLVSFHISNDHWLPHRTLVCVVYTSMVAYLMIFRVFRHFFMNFIS